MARVVLGQLDRLVHALEHPAGHPPVPAAGEADLHALLVELVAPAHEQRLVEAHQVAHLVGRPPPVLGGEGVEGEPAMPISRAPLTTSSNATSPAPCPSVRGSPRALAQRPFPSMTQATWVGTRVRSSSLGNRCVALGERAAIAWGALGGHASEPTAARPPVSGQGMIGCVDVEERLGRASADGDAARPTRRLATDARAAGDDAVAALAKVTAANVAAASNVPSNKRCAGPWPRRWPPGPTWSSRPAPAPASRWPTWCRPCSVGQEGGGGHGHQGAAGPAGREGPAAGRGRPGSCPSATPCSRAEVTTSAGNGWPRLAQAAIQPELADAPARWRAVRGSRRALGGLEGPVTRGSGQRGAARCCLVADHQDRRPG